ncbi:MULTISPECIES: sel1 repeat family protein [Rhodomicrobium]|uniref:sel1 repeat family protein n=1 Tax=Rhodomicrobium TaxID=1068 RepID=UPI000F73BD3A|nr:MULTISPECIES: sel1 repeat family protein [Rhodomicrobium]
MTRTARVLFGMRAVRLGWAGWPRPGLTAVAALLCGLGAAPHGALAKGPEIVTIPEVWVAPESELPLVILVRSGEPLPSKAMLLVRNLPADVTLSEGREFGPGVWVVPLNALPRLRLRAPARMSQNPVTLSLVTIEGKPLAQASVMLFVAPPPGKDDQLPTAALPVPQLFPADRALGSKLMEKGNEFIGAGNVAAARQFYQRAADRGLPEAAFALAATYDPRELARLKIISVQPDPVLAKKWYERARELGAPGVEARLQALP